MDWLDILEDPKKKKKEQANEKKSNDDEQYQAPFELMSEFLLLITQNKMIEALQKCDEILKFEPDNEMIKDYKKALGVYIEEILPEEEVEEEEEVDDDDDDNNNDDDNNDDDTNDSDDDKNSDRSYNDSDDDKNAEVNNRDDFKNMHISSDEAKSTATTSSLTDPKADTKQVNMPKYHETKARLGLK